MHYGSSISPDAGHAFPDHDFSYGLRKRGITPTFSISPVEVAAGGGGVSMFDSQGAYVGAAKIGGTRNVTVGSPTQTFTLDNWSSSDSGRNWAQRILDGNLNEWLDDFAQAAIAYKDITAPSGQTQPNPATTKNDKDEYFSAYDDVIVRFAFEMNGGLPHSAPSKVNLTNPVTPTPDTQRGIDELMAAWAFVADRIRRTAHSGEYATNVHFFFCPIVRDEGGIGDPLRDYFAPTKHVAGGLIQFLGLDYYKGGTATKNQLYLGTSDDSAVHQFDCYKRLWVNTKWGAEGIPMLIGEYGLRYGYGPPGKEGLKEFDWDCAQESGAFNERCRGKILLWSKTKLVDHCLNGPYKDNYLALRGVFYMAVDLYPVTRTVGSNSQELPYDAWALWGENTPATFRATNGDWELSQYLLDGSGTEDREERGTLGAMASGSWPGGSDSDEFSAWQWAQQRSTWKWRGKGGALFKTLT